MIENLYADIGYQSLTKHGEFVCGDHVEMILLFNPAPHAVSVVLPEKTGIKVALTGDEVFGMKIYTGSSFVECVKRQARWDD